MLFGADLTFARKEGGAINNHALDTLENSALFRSWKERLDAGLLPNTSIVIDSRVNMLMPGMYPSIPGWHGDDVPRGVKYAQPDLNGVDPNGFVHFMVLFSDNEAPVSATEFVVEPITLEVDPDNVWQSVNAGVEKLKPRTSKLREEILLRLAKKPCTGRVPVLRRAGAFSCACRLLTESLLTKFVNRFRFTCQLKRRVGNAIRKHFLCT